MILFGLLLMTFAKECFSIKGFNLDERCIKDEQCTTDPWIEPFPKCVNHRCSCASNSCVHYTLNGMGFSKYFCGECGVVGSSCTDDRNCSFPSSECSGGYCMCDAGYLRKDICIHYQPVSVSMETIILICTFVALLALNKVITSWKVVRALFLKMISCRRFSICNRDDDSDGETVYGYNPESGGKTPAYTISSRDFLVTSDDPDLQLALELSILAQEDLFPVEGSDTSSYDNSSNSFSRRSSVRGSRSSRRRETPRRSYPQDSLCSERSSSNPSSVLQSTSWTSHSENSSTISSTLSTPLGSIRLPKNTSEISSGGYFPLNPKKIINRPRAASAFSEATLESSRDNVQQKDFGTSGECQRNSKMEFPQSSECISLSEIGNREQPSLETNSEGDCSYTHTPSSPFFITNLGSSTSSNSLENRDDDTEGFPETEKKDYSKSVRTD